MSMNHRVLHTVSLESTKEVSELLKLMAESNSSFLSELQTSPGRGGVPIYKVYRYVPLGRVFEQFSLG